MAFKRFSWLIAAAALLGFGCCAARSSSSSSLLAASSSPLETSSGWWGWEILDTKSTTITPNNKKKQNNVSHATRKLQSSSAFFSANPRAPSRRTPDDIPEPNSISRAELEALVLQQSALSDSNGEALGPVSNNDDRDTSSTTANDNVRRRFLFLVIFLPAIALLGGVYVLRRRGRYTRQRNAAAIMSETEGLTKDYHPSAGKKPSQPYRDNTDDVPDKGYAEIRRNVI